MGIIGGILDVSRRSLNAQSLVIRTIGDNIANVNTPGYSRRTAELVTTQSTGTGNILTGSGVEVSRVVRSVDQFLNRELRERLGDRAYYDLRQQYLSRAEQPFALEDSPGNINFELTNFFQSVSDLAANPADIALRTRLLQSGQSLTASIRDAANQVATIQRELDDRVGDTVTQINTLSGQIAELNAQIRVGELGDQENLTLRDNRDELLRKLTELVPADVLENADGQINVTLPGNGFALVNGTNANELVIDKSPPFATYPPGMDGAPLSSIVFRFNGTSSTNEVDYTSILAGGGGELGALLNLRGLQSAGQTTAFQASGDLVELGGRIEAIARTMLTDFNQEYSGINSAEGSSGDLNGNQTGVFGLFNITGTALTDLDSNGRAQAADLGTATYSRVLSFVPQTAESIAAALDDDPAALTTRYNPGDARNLVDPDDSTRGLLALRNRQFTFSVGTRTFATGQTVEDFYHQTVSRLGSATSTAQSDFDAATAREDQVKELFTSTSGVSLDEEFAKLINFQRAFEAAGRMVRVGDEMLQEVLGILG